MKPPRPEIPDTPPQRGMKPPLLNPLKGTLRKKNPNQKQKREVNNGLEENSRFIIYY
jgi:hypothetical protein